MLPGLSGIELCRRLRQSNADPQPADHHADGARRGGRQGARLRDRCRRLRGQAVLRQRAAGARRRAVAPDEAASRRRRAQGRRHRAQSHGHVGAAQRQHHTSGPHGLSPARILHAVAGARVHARSAARRRVGRPTSTSTSAPSTCTSAGCARRCCRPGRATRSAPCAAPATASRPAETIGGAAFVSALDAFHRHTACNDGRQARASRSAGRCAR